jgi:hypothetical protein
VRKRIKSEDDEADGSDMDSDLSGFVDNAPLGDEDEIAEANAALREKYLEEADRQDEEAEAELINQVIYGRNRKRKRGEFDIEMLDDASKRKMKRLEERWA